MRSEGMCRNGGNADIPHQTGRDTMEYGGWTEIGRCDGMLFGQERLGCFWWFHRRGGDGEEGAK
jgi:hypothetical protein